MTFYRETVGHICSLDALQLAKKNMYLGSYFQIHAMRRLKTKVPELPTNIVFAPVTKLASYITLLERAGLDKEKIKNKVDAIKGQSVTTIFYLPDAIGGLGGDHIVILDDVHSMPSSVFQADTMKRKLCTLNTLGFYLFIFKLSIHFCRLRENVART